MRKIVVRAHSCSLQLALLALAGILLAANPSVATEDSDAERQSGHWRLGVRAGATFALSNGFGHHDKFSRFHLGVDSAIGAQLAYRITRLSGRYAWWVGVLPLLSSFHVHGVRQSDGERVSNRLPYFQIPLLLRRDLLPFFIAFGPWAGLLIRPNAVDTSVYSLVFMAAAVDFGLALPFDDGRLTISMMLQPIFLHFAAEDGVPTYLEPATLFVGYEW